jgi:soluble lytic murein transglycosylase-like protein
MRVAKRLQIAAAALVSALALSQAAHAASLEPLSNDDASRYAAAFTAASQGDFIAAQMNMVELQDRSLEGYIAYDQLMHPTAHKASFEELTAWLGKFRDLPLAERIFGLALRRRPPQALTPPAPALAGYGPRATPSSALSDGDRRAREAFFDGELKRALALATAAQDRWMIGMASYRLGAFAPAHAALRELSQDAGQDAWVRSAAAFWASRAAGALGDARLALEDLELAAGAPQTFYGMIAARQIRDRPDASARPTFARATASAEEALRLVSTDPRAHRAAALAQIGRLPEAANELHAGFALARDATEQDRWAALALALGAPIAAAATPLLTGQAEDYPTPELEPKSGFTLDRALVYAIVRQESRFNPQAVSTKGAVGLMQLTPEAAARAAGDDKLKSDMSPLFDPAFNLRVGQDYLAWLMDRNVGHDLIRAVAAYNGGPGMVQRAADLLGPEAADPLMLMECLPPAETRNYVQKVLAGYWTYKARFGESAPSLDAVARGERVIDARLDLAQPPHPTQLSGELLQAALR